MKRCRVVLQCARARPLKSAFALGLFPGQLAGAAHGLGLFPGLALLVAVLCFDIIGNGLRALTDPRGGRA